MSDVCSFWVCRCFILPHCAVWMGQRHNSVTFCSVCLLGGSNRGEVGKMSPAWVGNTEVHNGGTRMTANIWHLTPVFRLAAKTPSQVISKLKTQQKRKKKSPDDQQWLETETGWTCCIANFEIQPGARTTWRTLSSCLATWRSPIKLKPGHHLPPAFTVTPQTTGKLWHYWACPTGTIWQESKISV